MINGVGADIYGAKGQCVCESILRKVCAHCTWKRRKTSTAVQSVVFVSLEFAYEISMCCAQYSSYHLLSQRLPAVLPT